MFVVCGEALMDVFAVEVWVVPPVEVTVTGTVVMAVETRTWVRVSGTQDVSVVVLPMGDTFFEILAPTRSDTPGGRHLARQGDGGYMVILATRELAAHRARVRSLGVRIVLDQETRGEPHGQDWAGIHLHPADTGGLMISFDEPDPPNSWVGAGPHWRDFVSNEVVRGLVDRCILDTRAKKAPIAWPEVRSLANNPRFEFGRFAMLRQQQLCN